MRPVNIQNLYAGNKGSILDNRSTLTNDYKYVKKQFEDHFLGIMQHLTVYDKTLYCSPYTVPLRYSGIGAAHRGVILISLKTFIIKILYCK